MMHVELSDDRKVGSNIVGNADRGVIRILNICPNRDRRLQYAKSRGCSDWGEWRSLRFRRLLVGRREAAANKSRRYSQQYCADTYEDQTAVSHVSWFAT